MSKTIVTTLEPEAYCERRDDQKWYVVVKDHDLSWGWRPVSAWNSAASKLREERPEDYFHAIAGPSAYREWLAKGKS